MIALPTITGLAEELNIARRIRSTLREGDNMIVLKAFITIALNALSAISAPDLTLNRLTYTTTALLELR